MSGNDAHINQPLRTEQLEELLDILRDRFEKNTDRHPNLDWSNVQSNIEASPEKAWTLHEMERTGGEPDVVYQDEETGEYVFFDCSKETPDGRRSVCYDLEALQSRKKYPPENNAQDLAASIGIELLTEEEYRFLQTFGAFDTKTSSWIQTPDAIRSLGGALFCDRRYEHVFVYHNGASSYYSVRGFRGSLKV
ncbi:MAG TPA: DUF4256 domain-containing protein [Bacillota bacterium]|nr:DUF4256 domain-containing protein [Bacillota bacterium]